MAVGRVLVSRTLIMVAVCAIDEITDPRKVIQRIYDDGHDAHRLAAAVSSHFTGLFFSPSDPHALDQVETTQLMTRCMLTVSV